MLFDEAAHRRVRTRASTFADNLSLVHRWFRYSAGFSARWVGAMIQESLKAGEVRVLDPFAGSGTVLLEARGVSVPALGVEAHPFVARVARAKLFTTGNPEHFWRSALRVLRRAERTTSDISSYPTLIQKCYPGDVLIQLDQLRRSWLEDPKSEQWVSELCWLTLASILRECSPVGTASWQYVLPRKAKASSAIPFGAFKAKADQMFRDLSSIQENSTASEAALIQGDARDLKAIGERWATLVLTSPPYPNNFDYADATRLEMSFFGEVAGWGDLQETVRKFLVRSCTQHVSPIVGETEQMIKAAELGPIQQELTLVCEKLAHERHVHGGKKNYHTMIAAYFLDMAKVCLALRRVTADRCRVCFVVGDSAPYGIHVPVERWLGQLALASGFGLGALRRHAIATSNGRTGNIACHCTRGASGSRVSSWLPLPATSSDSSLASIAKRPSSPYSRHSPPNTGSFSSARGLVQRVLGPRFAGLFSSPRTSPA